MEHLNSGEVALNFIVDQNALCGTLNPVIYSKFRFKGFDV